jgi:hypothetical protein
MKKLCGYVKNLQQDLKVLLHLLLVFGKVLLELLPATDTWVDTVRLDAKIIDVEGNYAIYYK